MIIGILKETSPNETRIALTPNAVKRLTAKGIQVLIEKGLGNSVKISDEAFIKAGTAISLRQEILIKSDMLLRVRKPSLEEVALMKSGTVHLSFLDPFNEKDLITAFASKGISAISLEMIPRTTLAQKMDALSSQASLAGYTAVILAAERMQKILPMMMTPAGTIPPARVFIIGAGVAGLQAIATAKRLGARVDAFDTRPVVKEQVQSLGAKFVEIDLGETGQTKDGYAKALTPEQLTKQREGMAKVSAQSDIVITTAQVFGRKAPVIVTRDMISGMKPGSIVVDLAVETGGNVEGVELGKEIEINGVKIIGLANLPGKAAVDASEMLGANFVNFIEHFWNKEKNSFELKMDDEIMKGCLITHNGKVVNEKLTAKA
ncbi:MAG: Re/Si-specific NAD(P)(+) transhydrogenase subunit alpha [Candidatus Omnitrophica bacterium]|nr:Re/Si-specific NAD(P)(+) transhydrogenase subunit alpha [Candidatus Omnitrophota bacterium]